MKTGKIVGAQSDTVRTAEGTATLRRGSLRDYLAIARLDHSTKHVFIIPGIVLAYALLRPSLGHAALSVPLGFFSAVAIASANYVINEWLDREFDAFHPTKSRRSAVDSILSPHIVYAEYAALAAIGLGIAYTLGTLFFCTALSFVFSGLIYNVNPIRTKDKAYLDVISESINNPIRLTLGWAMVDPSTLPPISLLLAYWMGGAFLMCAKRLSEYREISSDGRVDLLHRYRRSFVSYTAENLTVSCFLYAMLSAFSVAIFLLKYRLEYIIAFPFFAILFALYFWLSLRKGSIAQRPERLFRSRRLMVALGVLVLLLLILTFVDVPFLSYLSNPELIHVN